MNTTGPRLLVLYDVALPGTPLLARLVSYQADLLHTRELDRLPYAAADWQSYAAVLLYVPDSLSRGCDLCRKVRLLTGAPIVLLAPVGAPDETMSVLQECADVLLAHNVEAAVIAGHLAALLRRSQPGPETISSCATGPRGYYDTCLEIDLVRRRVVVNGRSVHLTPTEFQFLAVLVRHAGELLPYDHLLTTVWGWRPPDNRIVHTFAAQVRAKLGEPAARYIVNDYGSGYRFVPAGSEAFDSN